MKTLFLLLHGQGRKTGTEALHQLLNSLKMSEGDSVLAIGPPSASFGDFKKSSRVHFTRAANAIGHGGLQKVGFRFAIENHYDWVMPIFTDIGMGYDAARVGSLLQAARETAVSENSAAIIGVPSAPYHFSLLGDTILNFFSSGKIRGWFSPNRIYAVSALKSVPFELAAMGHQFDTEILLQLCDRGYSTTAVFIERADIIRRLLAGKAGYLWNSFKAVVKYSLQKYSLFYDVRFQKEFGVPVLENSSGDKSYEEKWFDFSPHTILFRNKDMVPPGSMVMDIGCSRGYVAAQLAEKLKCRVTGVDILPPDKVENRGFDYIQIDLEKTPEAISNLMENNPYQLILLLDVLEHLSNPERFLLNLYRSRLRNVPRLLISTGNVGFIGVRFMLLFGFFNYGAKGILDITHKRLFTLRTFRNILDQTGFVILRTYFFPVPFRKLGFHAGPAQVLEGINRFLIYLSPSLFSYQMMLECVPGIIAMDHVEEN